VGAGVHAQANPLFPGHDCSATPPADALIGWHVCATGIDLPSGQGAYAFPGAFGASAYVAECGPQQPEANHAIEGNVLVNTGHKVVRLPLDAQGNPTSVQEFLDGLAEPTDVLFGPDGAMYVLDVPGVYRVAPAVPALS
jgi:glucose/arabinose dehydrogenase